MNMENLHAPTLRVLRLLERLAESDQGLTLTELANATCMTKGTIFPIMKTLAATNYVQLDASLRYTLGMNMCVFAGSFSRSNAWMGVIHNEMQNIVDSCDEICQLGVLDGLYVLYIDKIEAERNVRLVSFIGKRLPAQNTALGKALLAGVADAELREMFQGTAFVRRTENSVASIDDFLEQIRFTRENGYAMDDGELDRETKCYAVPVRQHGRAIAAISVSMPEFRCTKEKTQLILEQLFEKQNRIEGFLRGNPSAIPLKM